MFAVTYDDFKRKLQFKKDYPFIAVKVEDSCIAGTPMWDSLYAQFSKPDSDIHITIEPDGKTYTFYKLVPREEASKTDA